jgi:lantibiotic modifying enzyme
VTDIAQYLDIARSAERFIDGLRRPAEHGVRFSHSRERPEQTSHSLYNGSSGILLFYLELHAVTGERQYLDTAVAAADELVAYVRATKRQSCAIYTGWPGLAFALFEAGRRTGERRFAEAAVHCLDRLRASAHELGAGIGWIEPMPFSDIHGFKGDREIYDASVGAAGAGFVLLYAARAQLHPQALEWATAVGDRLLEVAIPTAAGVNWALMSDMPFPWNPSNFAHGGAGVGAFLAMLYESTREARFLDAARGAAAHLMHIADTVGDGHLVHHHDGDGANLYYLSACHGPPGTTRLFYLLQRITGDAAYAQWQDGALRGLLSTGAPEQRSAGFWNNVSQCCGDAGVGDYALNYFRSTGDQRYLELARREANELERRSTVVGTARCWPQAEHRERPRFLEAQSGYMQGAAGIGSFFVHLASTLAGEPVKIAFPDTPFESTPAVGA